MTTEVVDEVIQTYIEDNWYHLKFYSVDWKRLEVLKNRAIARGKFLDYINL